MSAVTETKKRTRKPRRNYQRELASLEAYCQVNIEILTEGPMPESQTSAVMSDFHQGKLTAYRQLLARIGGKHE